MQNDVVCLILSNPMAAEHRNQWTQTPLLERQGQTFVGSKWVFLDMKMSSRKEMSHSEQWNSEIIYLLIWINMKNLSWIPGYDKQIKIDWGVKQNPLAFTDSRRCANRGAFAGQPMWLKRACPCPPTQSPWTSLLWGGDALALWMQGSEAMGNRSTCKSISEESLRTSFY